MVKEQYNLYIDEEVKRNCDKHTSEVVEEFLRDFQKHRKNTSSLVLEIKETKDKLFKLEKTYQLICKQKENKEEEEENIFFN